jgi:hypothetical protein
MTVKDLFVADLQATLEETASVMADRVILESLAKNGKITLEEAEFYDAITRRVITEAAEEFVPEHLEMPLIQESDMGGEPMILTGEDGTVYNFNPATCELTPVEGTGGADENPSLDDMGEGADIEEPVLKESTEVEGESLEESTKEIAEVQEELTESQMIVSNLIKSLGA